MGNRASAAEPPPADPSAERELLSILVPVYNEAEVLPEFHRRLCAAVVGLPLLVEVLYVDDGSTDDSRAWLARLQVDDSRVAVLALSRNFGKETAMAAGLDHVQGDAVVIIDADLQDPPELLAALVDAWKQGFDQVEMQRASREGESAAKRWTAHAFYRLMTRVSDVAMTPDVGDFRLLSRRAVEALKTLRERNRFMKGLYAWVGYPRIQLTYHRERRHAGSSKWNYWRLWNLAIEGFTSFTVLPLKVASYVGLLVALAAFAYGVFVILKTLVFGEPITGYPSLMVVLLFLGGAQLLCVGILGEYLGRMFVETKQRPLYLIDTYCPPARTAIALSSRPVAP